MAMEGLDGVMPRSVASRRMTVAGVTKCVQLTGFGRMVAEAISWTASVEVFVASTASGLARPSSLAKTSFLIGISSKTASTIMSASATAPKSVVPVISPIRFSTSSLVSRPRDAVAS